MANPIIIHLMPSLLKGNASGNVKCPESGEGHNKFSSDMLKALHNSKNSAFNVASESKNISTMNNKKGYKYYLESLRKKLLAQGKQLNKTFLNENDIPLIKTFLLHCGFSDKKVEQFIKDLKDNNSDGKYNLSQILLKIAELGASERKKESNETVKQAAIPYIESILRDFNLSAKELDDVFGETRLEDGGLDLNKLVDKLKEISGSRSLKDGGVIDQNLSQQISEKMEMIGMSIPNKEKTDQIGLEDFIASLEQISKQFGKEKNETADLNKIMDKITERAELSDKKAETASPLKISSNYNFTESLLKEESDQKGRNVGSKKVISSLEKSKSDRNEFISSVIKQKDIKVKNYIGSNGDTSGRSEEAELSQNFNKRSALISSVKKDGYWMDTKADQINAPRNTEAFNFADMIKTVENGEKPLRANLPVSLMDQVGKQISKSILRGDQFVTLQLKPPDLGKVNIKMDIKDHSLKLSMTAEHHSVKELLLNNIHELKQALVQHGVKLEKVDVQINYNFNQSLNASKEGMDNGQGWKKDFNGEKIHPDNHTEKSHGRPINIMSRSNLLHLVA